MSACGSFRFRRRGDIVFNMKICPSCRQIFRDEYQFCLTDGAALDATDEPTLIASKPFTVPIADDAAWNTPTLFGAAINVDQRPAEASVKPRARIAYLAAGLLAGLIIAVGASAGVYLLVRGVPRPDERSALMTNNNAAPIRASMQLEGGPDAPSDASKEQKTAPDNRRKPQTARVIAINALVRLAPTMDAFPVDVLPYNSQVRILRRTGPWYLVKTNYNQTAWMHGNTLELIP